MKTLGNIYLLLLVALFSACNDPYEDSTYQVYDMNPVSSYLETRSDEFSEWITVLKYADLFNAVNQASSYFRYWFLQMKLCAVSILKRMYLLFRNWEKTMPVVLQNIIS